MSPREVLRWPDERLAAVCEPVKEITADVRVLAAEMLETMYAAPGRGLAAPQVGVLSRMFVMDATWKDAERSPMVFVNPVVTEQSTQMSTRDEGCLSIPGVEVAVTRPAGVTLYWLDLEGEQRTQEFEGFAAACVQHELDHLNGVMTMDRADPKDRARVLQAYHEVML